MRSVLGRLSRTRSKYGAGSGAAKLVLLKELEKARMPGAESLFELHEILCFLRAYPDDSPVLHQVERMLKSFGKRPEIRRFRADLDDTGIAGTDLYYTFFSGTARWLAARFPGRLSVAWGYFDDNGLLEKRLNLLATYSETPGLDELDLGNPVWLKRLKGKYETDAVFILKRFAALRLPPAVRDQLYDEMQLLLKLTWGPGGFSRTLEKLPGFPVSFQARPLRLERPDLWHAAAEAPLAVRAVSVGEGERLVTAARQAMILRSRDLDVFMQGDPRDVRIVEYPDGLSFVAIGFKPEGRLLLESVYGFLTLKNGVPIGYVLTAALNQSAEIAYNVFDTWRGYESATIYGRVLGMAAHLFGATAFTVPPYQLGHNNEEGQASGAWWFYQKLGFRPRKKSIVRLMNQELDRMRRNPDHRSSPGILQKLSEENVFWERGPRRRDILGVMPLYHVGLAVTDYLAARFGSDRERGLATTMDEARRMLDLPGPEGRTAGERLAFERWAPLVVLLRPDRWPATDRRELARIVRLKGGRRESDFVHAFDRHLRLRRALLRLARSVRS